jgi:hypothetical protein
VGSPQTLSEAARRIVAVSAADCAARVLGLFEDEARGDTRPRDAIARTRAFGRGELDGADEIRRRFGGATKAVGLAATDRPEPVGEEIHWQLSSTSIEAGTALRQLPPVGENRSGPLGQGLLASALLGTIIRDLLAGLAAAEG